MTSRARVYATLAVVAVVGIVLAALVFRNGAEFRPSRKTVFDLDEPVARTFVPSSDAH
jgi:hypothetical protein